MTVAPLQEGALLERRSTPGDIHRRVICRRETVGVPGPRSADEFQHCVLAASQSELFEQGVQAIGR